jgi:hypothetical protein
MTTTEMFTEDTTTDMSTTEMTTTEMFTEEPPTTTEMPTTVTDMNVSATTMAPEPQPTTIAAMPETTTVAATTMVPTTQAPIEQTTVAPTTVAPPPPPPAPVPIGDTVIDVPAVGTIVISDSSSSSGSTISLSTSSTSSSSSTFLSNFFSALANAGSEIAVAATFLIVPFFLLVLLTFFGAGFGRSADMNNDLLLRFFNDIYEDGQLDQPWLAAKVISQMFPDEFYPSGNHHRMVLTKQLAKMFPDQLGNLTSWQELSMPSVLIHMAPEKFAPLDFSNLDVYEELNEADDYADPKNVRHIVLKLLSMAQDTIPKVAGKYVTPEMDDKIKASIKRSKLAKLVQTIIPGAEDKLDQVEWLYDRLMTKMRTSQEEDVDEQDYEEPQEETVEPEKQTTTTAAPWRPARCPWGPVLCSLNRVTFQRNAVKRMDDSEVDIDDLLLKLSEQQEIKDRKPKVLPLWLQNLVKRTGEPAPTDEQAEKTETVSNDTKVHHLPALFRRVGNFRTVRRS